MAAKRYIPLDTAQEFFYAFGLRERTKLYDRWETGQGFERDAFAWVLGECPRIIALDWHIDADTTADVLSSAFESLELDARAVGDPDGSLVTITGGRSRAKVAIDGSDEAFDKLLIALRSAIPASVEIRESTTNGQSDAFVFSILPVATWRELESLDRSLVEEDWGAP
jgi:hypothetical protein